MKIIVKLLAAAMFVILAAPVKAQTDTVKKVIVICKDSELPRNNWGGSIDLMAVNGKVLQFNRTGSYIQAAATYTFDNGFGVFAEYGNRKEHIRTALAVGISQGKIEATNFASLTAVAKLGWDFIKKPRFGMTVGALGGVTTLSYALKTETSSKKATFTPALCVGGYLEASYMLSPKWGIFGGVQYAASRVNTSSTEVTKTTVNNDGVITTKEEKVTTPLEIKRNPVTVFAGFCFRF